MAYRSAASRLRRTCVGMMPWIECMVYMGVFSNRSISVMRQAGEGPVPVSGGRSAPCYYDEEARQAVTLPGIPPGRPHRHFSRQRQATSELRRCSHAAGRTDIHSGAAQQR